ncbi:hypothetical protein [Chromobacterium violaceum]|uniref:hypothetical protein n=1 Tax=Chromobacterium violaceum TaxID=536 RepID=UPI001B33D9F9|nr:hypothetical protein [Chromobacterium violaceum]MBP4045181.1 hypothetical protein [Chromobacterium violaceum]
MDVESVITLMLGLQFTGACIAAMGQKTRTPRKMAEYSAYPTLLFLMAAVVIFTTGAGTGDSSMARAYVPIWLIILAGAGLVASFLLFILLTIIIGIYEATKPQSDNN